MEERTRDLKDYLNILRKYKTSMLIIFVSVIIVSVAFAVLLPPRFKSSATILIERQSIPTELVQSTVTSYASERLQTIQARVMSRTNLLEIIDKFKLYKSRVKFETTEEIVERMRKDASMEVISAEVVDPRTGRPSMATIAFSVSYEGDNPAKVQRVANELTSLYLDENLKSRTQKAEDTSIFLREESERLAKDISELGEKIAIFKRENSEALPERQSINMQSLQRMESEISSLDTKIQNLDERSFYLKGQLLQIEPNDPGVHSTSSRLKLLETQYASLRSKYSEDHPDIIKIKNEIESLKLEVKGKVTSSSEIANKLTQLRSQYETLTKQYAPDHPDIIGTQRKISTLEDQLKNNTTNTEDTYYDDNPENPAYITLKAQLEGIKSDIKTSQQRKQILREKIATLEKQLSKTPEIEKEYTALLRDYQNAIQQYKETKAKLTKAESAKQLESESKGERFTLIDPPALPEQPISPNRPAILFFGFVLSLGGSIVYAIMSDMLAGVVRGAKNIQTVLGVPPLSVIPYQWNMLALKKRSQARKRFLLAGAISFVVLIILIHFIVSPLDVLWFRALRKLDSFL